MADPLPTRVHIDPPMNQWQATPRNGRTTPIIATGHQPYLWHPGILAKDLALDAFAKNNVCSMIHLVVDHNPLGSMSLDIPTQQASSLSVRHLVFGQAASGDQLPLNRLPPIPPSSIERALEVVESVAASAVRSGMSKIIQTYQAVGGREHLAAQMTSLLGRLKSAYLDQQQGTWSTGDLITPGFVDRLLSNPMQAVTLYNHAATAYPEAGIRTLYVGRDVVEVPLWAQDKGTCTPVYADIGDSNRPQLFTTKHNQHLDLTKHNAHRYLRPRAITLSAIMRSELCDLFIHGTGGGVYDQVTERWWRDWVGEELAPKAVVSADVYLPFDAPMGAPSEHARAQWFAHHLPHNVDRHAKEQGEIDAALSAEKRDLLDRMNDDRDKRRRAKAFKRIHAINAELRHRHDVLIQSARRQAEDARLGLANAEIARRRDWCFALYPDDQIDVLKQQILASLT